MKNPNNLTLSPTIIPFVFIISINWGFTKTWVNPITNLTRADEMELNFLIFV